MSARKYDRPCDEIPEYQVWRSLKTRCLNPSSTRYADYGGRGITICDRWKAPDGFASFIADMGSRPSPDHQIEREDNNGNYEPGNCVWATRIDQARNKRETIRLTWNGKTMPLVEWAELLGINRKTLYKRVSLWGWPAEKALTHAQPDEVTVEISGATMTLRDCSKHFGIRYGTIWWRYRNGLRGSALVAPLRHAD